MALVTESDVKGFLNITTEDPDLPEILAAAIEAVNYLCGPSAATACTDVVHGCGSLILHTTPVVSLTSVTGMSVGALTVADLWVDAESGVVRPRGFAASIPDDYYTVAYVAGRTTVPDSINLGIKRIVKRQMEAKRGKGRPGPGPDEQLVGDVYVPRDAMQVLTPYLRPPAAA